MPESPEDLGLPSSASSPIDLPDHFDHLIEGAAQAEAAASAPPSSRISKDEFHKLFIGGFKAAHHITRLQSLNVPDDGAAQAASAALYETIVDIPLLHFMLNPGGKWGQRIVAIGVFTVPIAIGVNAELADRRSPGSVGEDCRGCGSPRQAAPTEPGEPDDNNRYALTGGA